LCNLKFDLRPAGLKTGRKEQVMKSKRWIVLVVAVALLFIAVVALHYAGLFSYLFNSSRADEAIALSAVVLVGLALVVVLMAALVIVYWVLEVANKDQALALPEGSVRALIAFSLVLIFVCLGAFLYNNVNSEASVTGKLNKISEAQLSELQKQFTVAAEPARDNNGAQLTDAGGKLYNVTYFGRHSKEGDDFAKQIFTTLATVFVSVISFYFGSSSAVSAAKAARDAGTAGQKATPPSIAKLAPDNLPAGSPPTPLKITGDGLGSVTKVKFGSVEVKPDNAADKLVNVIVPAAVLAQAGTVKVSVVGDNGESSPLDFTVA
jgi:hypothetical protein